ncbi:hypothetical protein AAG570_005672 [Ranatra chinensis]|uniref:EF-hand domain-containing protein n=1 Tax=Ranatra chinensis TaxID=642074 RepID=A0ABD0XY42_9HEMI
MFEKSTKREATEIDLKIDACHPPSLIMEEMLNMKYRAAFRALDVEDRGVVASEKVRSFVEAALGSSFDANISEAILSSMGADRSGYVTFQLRKLLHRRSELSLDNKLTIYNVILKPTWTCNIELWGSDRKSNIDRIQTFQSKTLRTILDAPWKRGGVPTFNPHAHTQMMAIANDLLSESAAETPDGAAT